MIKNREAVTCNGRAAFYAAMWDDIRQCAMDHGWAVALHGSLASDMDIMAMPWTEEAVTFVEVVDAIVGLFDGNDLTVAGYEIDYESKPWGRIVASIPIWEDFHLDISCMWVEGKVEVPEKKKERRIVEVEGWYDPLLRITEIHVKYDDNNDAYETIAEYMSSIKPFYNQELFGMTEQEAKEFIRGKFREAGLWCDIGD